MTFRPRSRLRFRFAFLLCILTASTVLVAIPSRPGGSRADAAGDRVVSIYEEPKAVDVSELTDAQHEPPAAPYPYSGVMDPAVIALDFGEGNSPKQLASDEIPLFKRAVALGKIGEASSTIIRDYGKNTKWIDDLVRGKGHRIPDVFDDVNHVIGEVKNTSWVGLTPQIRNHLAWVEFKN